jgi:pantothenate kinase type III
LDIYLGNNWQGVAKIAGGAIIGGLGLASEALGSGDVAQVTANRLSHEEAVGDFITNAEQNGLRALGREVSVNTPFGRRVYDVVLQNEAGVITGVEIKSSAAAFARFDAAARQQFAADRWVNLYGASTIGKNSWMGVIDNTIKLLWEVP